MLWCMCCSRNQSVKLTWHIQINIIERQKRLKPFLAGSVQGLNFNKIVWMKNAHNYAKCVFLVWNIVWERLNNPLHFNKLHMLPNMLFMDFLLFFPSVSQQNSKYSPFSKNVKQLSFFSKAVRETMLSSDFASAISCQVQSGGVSRGTL